MAHDVTFDTVLLETRHVKAALSAMMVKTDCKDARGLAQLIRMGWFRPVHAKSMGSQEVRALLVARKQLLGRLIDVELSIQRNPARLWSEGRRGDAQGL
jgi:transposase